MRTSPAGKIRLASFTILTTSIGLNWRRLQLHRIDIELDLAILAPERLRYRSAGHIRDLVANVELPLVMELRFVQPLALERHQADRQTRSIELQHDGRQRALRQTAQIAIARLAISLTAASGSVPG